MRTGIKSAVVSICSRFVLRLLQEQEVEQRLWEIANAPRNVERTPGNLAAELARRATQQTAEYVERHMADVPAFARRNDLLKYSLSRAGDGLYFEFGVYRGASINFIAEQVQTTVHGFDAWEGLPEYWIDGAPKGEMTTGGDLPVVRENVELHKGWFENTLPKFAADHPEPVAFMHVDCDLYSSSRTVFEVFGPRIRPGTVIQFDEYFNYSGWQYHEFRAFHEFIESSHLRYRYLGYVRSGYSAAVIIQ